jgi:hypothetical protein
MLPLVLKAGLQVPALQVDVEHSLAAVQAVDVSAWPSELQVITPVPLHRVAFGTHLLHLRFVASHKLAPHVIPLPAKPEPSALQVCRVRPSEEQLFALGVQDIGVQSPAASLHSAAESQVFSCM